MRNLYRHLIAFIFPLLALAACSHNGGGDSRLWGTWKLDSVTVDGTPDADYQGNIFWKFQADVVLMQEVDDAMHEGVDHFGTWTLTDNGSTLTLNFTHSEDAYEPGTGPYAPPVGIFLEPGITVLEIITLEGNTLVARHTVNGAVVTYYLTRR